MAAVYLKDLRKDEFKKFVDSFDVVMSDIDGTIYIMRPLPGVPDFLNYMQKFGKRIYIVTNNSMHTSDENAMKMKQCSINVPVENILYPSMAVIDYLKSRNFDKHVFCVTAQEAINDLTAAGLKCKSGPLHAPRRYTEFSPVFNDDPDVGAVFFDIDFQINMAKVYSASIYLERPDVHFLAGATDEVAPFRKSKDKSKVSVFLPTVLLPSVKKYTGREPVLLAKPSREFVQFINKRTGVTNPSRVLFIGDSIVSDVQLGKNAGYQTLLVLNTVSYTEMINSSDVLPDYYANDLAEIVPLLSLV